mgnify:CR=1 FL=1
MKNALDFFRGYWDNLRKDIDTLAGITPGTEACFLVGSSHDIPCFIHYIQPMEVTATDRAEIRSVIERQLKAFQNDDAIGAFAFASPGIQMRFKSPENFMEMVKTAYQAVYRPRSVLFEDLTKMGGVLTQPVLLLDAEGVLMRALYLMEKQADASWRINGCYVIPVETSSH